jgi:hypothetical protein
MANPWEFLEAWARENVHATAFGDEATARQSFRFFPLRTRKRCKRRSCASRRERQALMPRGPKGEKRPADVIGNAVHVMRITPAMAAKLTDRLWSWEEIVQAMDADVPAKKRGPYKKLVEEISN